MTNIKRIFEDWKFATGLVAFAIATVALFLSVFLIVSTLAVEGQYDYPNQITVSASGEVVAIPDIATFNFSVNETSESVDSAQNAAAEKINSAISYLKENGVDEKDIKTTSYNAYPKYEWIQELCLEGRCPGGKQELVGYQVSQTISVKVRETDKAGELLSGIGAFEISNISGLSFTIDDREALEDQARDAAIANAKVKAKNLAKSLGVDLEDITSFGEEENYYGGYGGEFAESAVYGASKSIAEIPTGENTITKTVWITYELES